MRVKLTCDSKIDILRQTKGRQGSWENCRFLLNQPVDVCDGWVVFDELAQSEKTICDPSKTIFVAGEPASVHQYNERFLSQFAVVITPQKNVNHPGVINHHPAYPWYVGIRFRDRGSIRITQFNYDDFKRMDTIPKTKDLSVICSSKTMTSDHRKRLAFLEVVSAHLGSSLDMFSGEHQYVEDKWEALAPYKYSIVLENSENEHYWTEKVADAFLASTFPFYWGCSNLEDYFPRESFQRIDINYPEEAAQLISTAIKRNTYERALPHIYKAHELILDQYNLFPVVVNLMQDLPASQPRPVLIRPESYFTTSSIRRLGRTVKRLVKLPLSL